MKRAVGPVFRARALDDASAVPLYRQLHDLLCEALLTGTIPPGSRLPSTRALAEDLGVSRNTVAAAFDRLVDEGLIESRVGAGSFASAAWDERRDETVPGDTGRSGDEAPMSSKREGARAPGLATRSAGLSRRGRVIVRGVQGRDPSTPRAFSVGVPALDAFPLETWRRIVSRRARQLQAPDLGHGDPQGDPRLRALIARHLNTARGVRCAAEQVIILPSAQFGLDLASRVLLDPGDAVWIEEPGYLGARGAFRVAGARLVPVPVDASGLDVAMGRARCPEARLAYVTPSHQFPLGGSMSLRRRLQLLAWAEAAGAWIIEDDYDSEYRYSGPANQALQGLDRAGRVLYLGTFTKVLFPALRLAYAVLPKDVVQSFVAARFLVDGHVQSAVQAALADFIEAGHLVGHLRRMRALYRNRRDVLLGEADRRFGDLLAFVDVEAGMHVTARLTRGTDRAWVTAAAEQGIDLAPLSRYYLGPNPEQGVAFGYAHMPPDEIVRALRRLETVVDAVGGR